MIRKYIVILVTLFAMLTTGCTNENLEECNSGLDLHFTFTHNTTNTELFGEQVNRVRVYLFDEQGVMQLYALDNGRTLEYTYMDNGALKSVSTVNPAGALPNGYTMHLAVPAGKYQVLSWAGSATVNEPTFMHGRVTDLATGAHIEGVEVGKTRIEELRMFLKRKSSSGVVEPIVAQIDDLWYGAVGTRHPQTNAYTFQTVEVNALAPVSHTVELLRNSNLLKVTVTGAQIRQNDIWLMGANGRYNFQNTIDLSAPLVRYSASSLTAEGDKLVASIKLLRMDMERHKAQPMLLYLQAADGTPILTEPLDVVKVLHQARDINTGKYIYNTQSDFDKIYEHPIEVQVSGVGTDLVVRVFVRGWEIVSVVPEGK